MSRLRFPSPLPTGGAGSSSAIVLAAEIMDLVDATITSIAAPSVVRDIGGGDTTMQWLAAAYTLAFAVGLITGGRLGDIYGRKRLFLIGATGFGAMSALCAAAWSPGSLIAFRALQGGFGALMIPQGLGMIKTLFPPKEMATAFGLWGPVMALSAIAGPILGGFLVDSDVAGLGWRAVFLINVPIAVATVAAGLRFMVEARSPRRSAWTWWAWASSASPCSRCCSRSSRAASTTGLRGCSS